MNPSIKKSAVIAGGGVAGLAAAVFLDELGYDVTLYERKSILGGRTYSFVDKKTGAIVDNGQHLMIGAYHETIAFLERIGSKHTIEAKIPTIVPLVNQEGRKAFFTLEDIKPPLHLLKALFSFRNFSFADKLACLRLGTVLQKIQSGKLPLPENETVTQWLTRLKQTPRVRKDFWEVLTLATLNDHPDVTSADGLVTVMLKSYFEARGDGFLVFPKAGLSEVFCDPAETYLKMRGQSVIKGVGVEEIRVLNGQAQGFVLSDGTVRKADVYVSALPFRPLLHVLPPAVVDADPRLAVLRQFESSPILSINLFFDAPVMEDAFLGSSATQVHWFFNREAYLGSGGHHIMGVLSGAYEYLEKSKEEIVAFAVSELQRISPLAKGAKLIHSLVNKEREATLSSRVGVNASRPDQKIFDNFYVIGDWTRTGLPATIESAVKSAKLLAERLA